MSNWKDKCTFLNPQNAGIAKEINGQEIRFYPVSVGKLFELRAVAQPLAASLMTLMSDNLNDSGVHRGTDEAGNPYESIMPPTPELAGERKRQQNTAVTELVDALSNKTNMAIVGDIIMDSMREVFEPGSKENPPAIEFINSIPAPLLPQFIKGVVEANKGILGDFGGKAGGLLENVFEKVKERANEVSKTNKESEQSEPKTTG